MNAPALALPPQDLQEFCARHHVHKLSLFGSIPTQRFRADSDIDLLVEFEPGHSPGLFGMIGMELELSEKLGRKVDLRTPRELSRYFRYQVIANAAVQYER